MGNFDLRVRVDLGNVLQDIDRSIERGIRKGANDLGDKAKDTARVRIKNAHIDGAVFTGETLASMRDVVVPDGEGGYHLIVWNDADQAPYVEHGVAGVRSGRSTAGFKYTTKKPPLAALIPWVEMKLGGFYIDHDGNLTEGSLTPIILTDGGEPKSVTTELDFGVGTVFEPDISDVNGDSSELSAGVGDSSGTFMVRFASGGRGVFKDRELIGRDVGLVDNEQVFTGISNRMGWELGPENTAFEFQWQYLDPDTNDVSDRRFSGNLQAFVENSETLDDWVYDHGDAAFRNVLEDDENIRLLARTYLLDYLIGNKDRHAGNVVIDADGKLHAIDNGGFRYGGHAPTNPPLSGMTFIRDDLEYEEYMERIFDTMKIEYAKLWDNRADVLDSFRVHGTVNRNKPWFIRAKQLLDEDHPTGFTLDEYFWDDLNDAIDFWQAIMDAERANTPDPPDPDPDPVEVSDILDDLFDGV